MEIDRELSILTNQETQQVFVTAFEAALTGGWCRDRTNEESPPVGGPYFCFSCIAAPGREPASVFFVVREGGSLRYCNMVLGVGPVSGRENLGSTREQRDRILEDFHDLAKPVADSLGIIVVLTAATVDVAELLGSDAFASLQCYARAANRSNGNFHPDDATRWYSFVIAAHRFQSRLSDRELREWLVEKGWQADVADRLADDYEQGRSLLKQYEEGT